MKSYKSYTIQNCFRPKSSSSLCIGISDFILSKYEYFKCGFKGKASWEGSIKISQSFAQKYPITEFKTKKDGRPFNVRVIPIDDITNQNSDIFATPQMMEVEVKGLARAKLLLENNTIKEICDFFDTPKERTRIYDLKPIPKN